MRTDRRLFIVPVIIILAIICIEVDLKKCYTLLIFKKEDNIITPARKVVLEENVFLEYKRYITTTQTKCDNISRCGPPNNAGYDICVDSVYKPIQPCLVYSFGSRFDFGFENDMHRKFSCEIHTFDPSEPVGGHHIPEFITFHLMGLSDTDHTNIFGWNMKTLYSIRKYLNHSSRVMDVLKIDIDGDEWKAVPQILESISNRYIKQIVMEIHFGRVMTGQKRNGFMSRLSVHYGDADIYSQLSILKQIKTHGFLIFMTEVNKITKVQLPHKGTLFTHNVISLKNTNLA